MCGKEFGKSFADIYSQVPVAVRTGVMGILKPPDTEWDEAKSTDESVKQCNEDTE